MDAAENRELGVFPLGLVALPGERIPLHIFEPRYRALVADCALESQPFVIALAGEESVARIGCTVRLDGVIRRFSDGRMNLVVAGVGRVEILERTEGRPYLTARVRELPDLAPAADPALAAAVLDGFRRVTLAVAGEPREPDMHGGILLSYAVAGALELDADTKQALLETRYENERLRAVSALLDTALAGLDRSEIAAERAKSNGKVSHE